MVDSGQGEDLREAFPTILLPWYRRGDLPTVPFQFLLCFCLLLFRTHIAAHYPAVRMLARSPYTWLLLVVGYWASIVASKSFAGAYERILLYYTYNVTLKYKGPSQSYILRQLDSVKDSALWQVSYSQKGNRGSLPDGQMTWEEFEASLHNDKSITPKDIPTLNPANFDQVALNLWNKKMGGFFKVELAAGVIPPPKVQYFTYVEGLKEIVKDARANM
jgi:hypothetical protein